MTIPIVCGGTTELGLCMGHGGKTMRQVVIYPGEDGYWVAECLSLLGCTSHGQTKEEAFNE